jgi:hypothetical protein
LKDLELTMSLLIFLPSDNLQPQLAELLKPSLRRDIASRVNEAILCSMAGGRGEAKIRSLGRLRLWAENKARESGKDLPPYIPLGLQDADHVSEMNGNGEAPDIMVQ